MNRKCRSVEEVTRDLNDRKRALAVHYSRYDAASKQCNWQIERFEQARISEILKEIKDLNEELHGPYTE